MITTDIDATAAATTAVATTTCLLLFGKPVIDCCCSDCGRQQYHTKVPIAPASSKASCKSTNMVSPLSQSSCVHDSNISCKELWDGLSGRCVVASWNHIHVGFYIN